MAELSEHRADDGTGPAPGPEPTIGAPRWVRVSAIIGLAIVVLFVLMMLFGGAEHGPGRHSGSDDDPRQAPSSVGGSGDADAHAPPRGGHG
jgi:hypothetical protein